MEAAAEESVFINPIAKRVIATQRYQRLSDAEILFSNLLLYERATR
jgi:hypothetical protein